jgi:NitT/TauT family transport system ATP-binding protein
MRGEFFVVVGPSGCGKSTLLEIIAGLNARPTAARTLEGNADRGEVPEGIGVVFQEDASFPWLTVTDNIASACARRARQAEIARARRPCAAPDGPAEFAAAYPVQLSGGMRQRVCLARTWCSARA